MNDDRRRRIRNLAPKAPKAIGPFRFIALRVRSASGRARRSVQSTSARVVTKSATIVGPNVGKVVMVGLLATTTAGFALGRASAPVAPSLIVARASTSPSAQPSFSGLPTTSPEASSSIGPSIEPSLEPSPSPGPSVEPTPIVTPTPVVIVVHATPQIVYVTPRPTIAPTPRPTATPSPRPVLPGCRRHPTKPHCQ